MKIGIVGRGRLGGALGAAARAADHEVVFLRRPGASEHAHEGATEAELDAALAWDAFDLVLLAFEQRAERASELEEDGALAQLRRISPSLPIASAVATPSPDVIDAFLPDHAITHFLTTPAARLPGAIALLRPADADPRPLRAALPALAWIEPRSLEDYGRASLLLLASAMACAAIGRLQQMLPEPSRAGDLELLSHALDDAKRLLELNGVDGVAAFSSVATPGGITQRLHDVIFRAG